MCLPALKAAAAKKEVLMASGWPSAPSGHSTVALFS
jgi:hypothetical protein